MPRPRKTIIENKDSAEPDEEEEVAETITRMDSKTAYSGKKQKVVSPVMDQEACDKENAYRASTGKKYIKCVVVQSRVPKIKKCKK